MQLNVTASIESGKFISLYGASGAGKTSILRMLAGFMKPDNGFIKVNDAVWFDASGKSHLEPQQRKIGFVFQDYALFPNMKFRENIAFALSKNESKNIVDELLDVTGLSNLAARKIQALSGGQQQRVAIARALAMSPDLVLADEPTGNLDTKSADAVFDLMRRVNRESGTSFLLVTHNMDLARRCDRIIQVVDGRIAGH